MTECTHIFQPSRVHYEDRIVRTMYYCQCQFCGEIRKRTRVLDQKVLYHEVPVEFDLPFKEKFNVRHTERFPEDEDSDPEY